MDYFLAIDFDGTIANFDVTDTVLEEFSTPEWLEVEKQWEAGEIGSKECLQRQMALIATPLEKILQFVETIEIDPTFINFVLTLKQQQVPLAIISDGFRVFIERILEKNGLSGLAIFANELCEVKGQLVTSYPYSVDLCSSGTCKCMTSQQAADGLPVYLIGDGRSDFCLAGAADFVYAKGKLVDYCIHKKIPHYVYTDFQDIMRDLHDKRIGKSVIA
jgi:2-hydroxy-3-keto-5-methylthiopentenyl-1-phosphate phosphatase